MLNSDVKALYDSGSVISRQMVRISLGTEEIGFINGRESLTYNGVVYHPYSLFEVSDLSSGTGTSASGSFTLKLAARPDDGLTPEILQQIETVDYRDRPVTVYDAYFAEDGVSVLQVVPAKRGYIDVVEHIDNAEDGCYAVATCEGRQLDYSRTNGRVRSVADQKRRSSTDRFFEHAATAGRIEKSWGK